MKLPSLLMAEKIEPKILLIDKAVVTLLIRSFFNNGELFANCTYTISCYIIAVQEVVALKEQKYHLYLSDDEYRQTIQSLVRLKNNLISQGRYTDAVDDVLFKVLKTKRACTRNNHILWLGKRRHNRPYRYRWKVRKRKCLHHRGQFVRHVQNQNISGWKFSYLRIRHSGILKKMAARLSSHQVHYSWEILYRNVSVCRYTAPPLSCVLSL